MAPLHRALAFAEIDKVAVLVAKHLDLDVSRLLNQLLDIDFMISESAQRLTLPCGERRCQFIAAIDAPHPFTATAGDSLQHHGIANALGELLRLGDGREGAYRTGNERQAGTSGCLPSPRLRSHDLHRTGRRANELYPRFATGFRELRVLRKKPIARVDRISTASLRDLEKAIDVQI